MANTYHQIYIQTVFAVKYRQAVIEKEWRTKLFGVIGNLINEANCKTIIVNGVEDPRPLFHRAKTCDICFRIDENSKSKIIEIH